MSSGLPEGPLVSIVLPTHNGARYLRQSVESCLGQTHRNLELIVVDDASTDDTPGILGSLQDPRMAVVRNGSNLGLPRSLNLGFARARGEFLTWTSDDNWYAPEAIAAMLAALRELPAEFVYCDYFRVDEFAGGGPVLRKFTDDPGLSAENFVGPCVLYSRRVAEAVGDYDAETPLAEDYDYWIRASRVAPLRHLARPLYYYRVHGGSLSARFLPGGGIHAAAALVRIKNRLSTSEDEALRLARDLAREEYWRSAWPVRAVGRMLRTLSGGKAELSERRAKRVHAPRIRAVIEDYASGRTPFAQAAAAVAAMLAGPAGGAGEHAS